MCFPVKILAGWRGRDAAGFVHITPPFGSIGACLDYDRDCYEMPADHPNASPEAVWAACWVIDKERGQCPFVD